MRAEEAKICGFGPIATPILGETVAKAPDKTEDLRFRR
jgi:hypothetical protein